MESLMEPQLHIAGILLAYSVIIVAVLSPGPAVFGIIGTALERGRRPAVWFSIGVVCGSAFWGTASALGMSALMLKYSHALYAIKIIGGLFLIWLAFKSLRSAFQPPKPIGQEDQAKGGLLRVWSSGFLLHLTNPKGIIGWIATIALGVTPESPIWVSFAIVLGGVTLSFIGHVGYAVLFSSRAVVSLYYRIRRPIIFAFSGLFGVAGLTLLSSRP